MESRVVLIKEVLAACGLSGNSWTPSETLQQRREYIFKMERRLRESLPAHVVGDLAPLREKNNVRTVIALMRRLSRYIEGAVVSKPMAKK